MSPSHPHYLPLHIAFKMRLPWVDNQAVLKLQTREPQYLESTVLRELPHFNHNSQFKPPAVASAPRENLFGVADGMKMPECCSSANTVPIDPSCLNGSDARGGEFAHPEALRPCLDRLTLYIAVPILVEDHEGTAVERGLTSHLLDKDRDSIFPG